MLISFENYRSLKFNDLRKTPKKLPCFSNKTAFGVSQYHESRNESCSFHVRVNSSCQLLIAVFSVLRLMDSVEGGASPPLLLYKPIVSRPKSPF